MTRSRLFLLLVALAAVPVMVLPVAGCSRSHAPSASAKRWTCVMHPQIVRDAPGDCPVCGMKLVPLEPTPTSSRADRKAADGAPQGPEGLATITIDAEKQQLIGLKTAVVSRGPIETAIRTTGRVTFDETRIHHVHTKYDAYVEHVPDEVNFVGAPVTRGQRLLSLYSPDLFATEQEYLLAFRAQRSLAGSGLPSVARGGVDLLEAARQRLLLWDMGAEEIAALEKRGVASKIFNLDAPFSGFVIGKMAVHGMKVTAADSLFDIADLSRVWVVADVYEYELPRVAVGQTATMTLTYWPDKAWTGRVMYVFPMVDEKTRTVKVRLEFANPGVELKPEMFANVAILGKSRTVLKVPDDAVLDSGTRKIVFVSLGQGRLQPRDIRTGDHVQGVYEVTGGLAEGETVVLGANFLVDSESRLKAALSAYGTAGPAEPAKKP